MTRSSERRGEAPFERPAMSGIDRRGAPPTIATTCDVLVGGIFDIDDPGCAGLMSDAMFGRIADGSAGGMAVNGMDKAN